LPDDLLASLRDYAEYLFATLEAEDAAWEERFASPKLREWSEKQAKAMAAGEVKTDPIECDGE